MSASEKLNRNLQCLSAPLNKKAAGYFLFDFLHRMSGEVVGKRNAVIGHEAPDLAGRRTQATEQVPGLRSRPGSLSTFNEKH
jgi:hypothetical protein